MTIRPHHRCGEEGRTAWQRKLDILRDRAWTQPLPIYAYLIEHPEGIYLVDTGDRALGDATYDVDLLLTNRVDGVTYDVEVSQRTLGRLRLLARQQPTVVLSAHDPGAPERLVQKRCLLAEEEALRA